MHPNIDGLDGITLIEHTQGWLSHVTVISREYQAVASHMFCITREREEQNAEIGNSLMSLLVHLYHVTSEGHKGAKQSCVQLDQSLRLVDDAHSRLKVWSVHDSKRNCHLVPETHPDCLLYVSKETSWS